MTIDDAVLIDYALGTVGREQAKEVESFLRAHPEAAIRVRGMQDDLANLVMSIPPETVGEGAEDALVQRLRRTSRPPLPHDRRKARSGRRSSRWAAFGLAGALGLTAWLILAPLLRSDRVSGTLERYQSQPGALSTPLVTEDGRDLGTLVRLSDGRLFVAFDERPAEGVYQIWALGEAGTEALAVVDGRTHLAEALPAEADRLAVTLEPEGGSEEPTSEPLVVQPL